MRHSGKPPAFPSGHRPSRPSQNALQTFAPVSTSVAAPRLSSRNLDFCLLAVCSCVLTLLCHQSIPISFNTSSSSTTSSMAASSTSPSQIAFTLKAGLFTTSQQRDNGEAELQDAEEES